MQDFKNTLNKIIGLRIKSKRKDLNLSQDALAKYLDLRRTSISNIELGRHQIPLYLLYKLSVLLKTDIIEIIPTYNEIIELMDSEINEYSKILESKKLNNIERESVKNILKNIGNNDNQSH